MNSLHLLKKSTLFINSIRLSRLNVYLNISKCHVQKLCTAAGFELHTKYENNANSETHRKSVRSLKQSDQFGKLQTPLDFTFNDKRSLPPISKMHRKKVVKIKRPVNDQSDIFGNLSEKEPMCYSDFHEEAKEDNDLSDDSFIIKKISKRYRRPEKYLEEMKRLVKEKKVKEALGLFVEMKRNFVAPLINHYTIMIGVCGRLGYTEMAFKLLRQMTDRGFKPTCATLTGLFNSCAESPFPEYGLKKARLLKEKVEAKNWELNQTSYHAMIKAFGKCGDLHTAFEIVDEMAEKDIKIDTSTYSFLLMSCISNKEAGFTYAIELWRKMKAKRSIPNVFTCNLLLRATRDCDVGPEEISCLLLQHWSSYSKRPYGFMTKESLSKEPFLKLQSGIDGIVSEPSVDVQKGCHNLEGNGEKPSEFDDENKIPSYDLQHAPNKSMTTQNLETPVASLLSARPMNGPEILEIVNIKTPSDRLSLLGGIEGFLEFMSKTKIKPNITTFNLLLECLPGSIEEEEKLLSTLDSYQIKPNIDFFNVLIKKRNLRKETEAAKQVLILINKYELTPDIMTFGALSLGCKTLQKASTLIGEMKKFGAYPNIEIAGTMVRTACLYLDFPYMKYALKLMEEEQIKPNERILLVLEKTLSNAKKSVILLEHGKEVDKFFQRKNLQEDFKDFFDFYEEWLKRVTFEPEKHPWLQYKTDIIDRTKKEEFVKEK